MRIVPVLCFLALAANASAQDILVAPKMRAGDRFKLEISRTRENVPPSPQDGKGSKTVDVTMLTATPAGFTIEWEPGSATGSVGDLPEALMLTAGDAMRGMKPVIRLTPDGEVAGLVNETEVLAKMQAAVDVIRRDLAENAPPHMVVTERLSPGRTMSMSFTPDRGGNWIFPNSMPLGQMRAR